MSLVSTYVESREGNWYKNPTVKGDGWFICWDDDEPIEIVAKKGVMIDMVLRELRQKGWDLMTISKAYHGASRMFEGVFSPAIAQFLKQRSNGPTDEMLQGSERCPKKPQGQGVYYSNTANGNGGFF